MKDRDIIRELIRENGNLAIAVRLLLEKHDRPILALLTNDLNYIIMNTTLTLGINALTQVVLLDNTTLLPNTTASFSGLSVSSDTPSVATFVVDGTVPTQIDATPVAIGSGNLLIAVTATYIDSVSQLSVTAPFTASVPFTVQLGAEGVTLTITGFTNASGTGSGTTSSTSSTTSTSTTV